MWGDGLGRMSRRRAREGHGARVGSTLLSGGDGGKSGQALASGLWPGAPRVGEGEGAPPSLIRAAGGGSGAWGDCVGVFGFVISGRSPKELKTRHFGHAAKGDTSPFQADCRRGLLLAFPVRSPKELKTRHFGHATEEDDLPFRAGCRRGLLLAYPVRWPKAGWLATQGRLPESGYSPPRSGNRKG